VPADEARGLGRQMRGEMHDLNCAADSRVFNDRLVGDRAPGEEAILSTSASTGQ
jgi:hypothetical protein